MDKFREQLKLDQKKRDEVSSVVSLLDHLVGLVKYLKMVVSQDLGEQWNIEEMKKCFKVIFKVDTVL